MRPLFRGDGCSINEAGISTSGNALMHFVDGITNDNLHAQQLRDGFVGGARPPGHMLGPAGQMLAHGPPSGLEEAWQDAGPRSREHGPMFGEHMTDQFRRHVMHGPPPGAEQPQEMGFFPQGPMVGPTNPGMPPQAMIRPQAPPDVQMEAAWAQTGQRGIGQAPASSSTAMQRPTGATHPQEMGFQSAGPMAMRPGFYGGMPPMSMMRPPPYLSSMHAHPPMEVVVPQAAPAAQMEPQELPQEVEESAPVQDREAMMEEAWRETEERQEQHKETATDDTDLAQAAQMVEMLRNSGNPKFMNSHFVNFIDKVSKGDLQFKENTVVDRSGQEVDWDALYDTDMANTSAAQTKDLALIAQHSSSIPGPEAATSLLEQVTKSPMQEVYHNAAMQEGMMHPDATDFGSMWHPEYAQLMEEEFRLAQEEFRLSQDHMNAMSAFADDPMLNQYRPWEPGNRGEYKFAEENRYLEQDDLLAQALRLIREGRDREAILCLEAEVQRNPDSSEGWRQLGQLYAQLDQDVEAIQCLRKGHDVDPYNLDSLLELGVSCTNELDQHQALRYLRRWIENHEVHQELLEGLAPPEEHDYEAWKMQVTDLFQQAASRHPTDSDVFSALGVIQNIGRDYDSAIRALATACRLRPHDHTAWNKLGATLANSGKSDAAVKAYFQGLHLKPNYARCWSNLAIAHANLGQHEDAARFYLSSLVLNPNAVHNWNFLQSAAINMDNTGMFQAIEARDLATASQLIPGVVKPEELSMPRQELPEPADMILAGMGL